MAPSPTAIPTPFGRYEERIWERDPGAQGRRARIGGPYEVFFPERIAERDFALNGDAISAIAEAAKALEHLKHSPPKIATLGALARNLLRSESVASSRIEGINISHRRLARAAYQDAQGDGHDRDAAEVLGNVNAMELAIEIGASRSPFKIAAIEDIHRTLLRFTSDRDIAGVIREKQNWIGGNQWNPVGASYVPPPHEEVRPLLEDLCEFAERDDLAPIAQVAIAHAQFETIHPFADGNGRTGRALIYSILRRRGEVEDYIPPISLVLAAETKGYIGGLEQYRHSDISGWCETFAYATARAVGEAGRLADEIEERQANWLERLGQPRSDAAVRQLVSALPAQPVIDVAAGQEITGKSHVAVGAALKQLEEAGIIRKLNEKKWGKAWECDELLELVDEFEETLSAP